MREESKNWFEQAKIDLDTAKFNFKGERFYASVFFSQQAAEKSLKALYLEEKRCPVLHHNLVDIADELEAPEEVISACRMLNPHYTVSRYPDAASGIPSEVYDKKITSIYLMEAKKVVRWVRDNLES
ncbi:MAG: HEPN domain-containing protein [Candidatus Micrarchaeia archaeon]|jgi:HEPN domain-containing protein